jgi:hypothetical protein
VWLHNWWRSGISIPIGQRSRVQLPAGTMLVYYESPVAVPAGDAVLRAFDGNDDPVPVKRLDGSMDYRLLLSGWSGRAMWEITIPQAGSYTMVCNNYTVFSDADLPAEDRVALLKRPDSFRQVALVRTFVQVTGATLTMTAVLTLYLLHSLTLQKRKKLAAAT